MEKGIFSPQTMVNQWLLVRLGDEFYALAGVGVREVLRYRAPVTVPGAPPSLPGLLNQRGVVLTTVDMRPLLGLNAALPGRTSRYVHLHHEGADLALIVDGVIDLVEIDSDSIEALPPSFDPLRARLMQSMVRYDKLLVGLMDLDALLQALREEP